MNDSLTKGELAMKVKVRKEITIGLVFFFVAVGMSWCVSGSRDTIVTNPTNNPTQANNSITDWTKDVFTFNSSGDPYLISNSSYVEIKNLDILKISYVQEDTLVTLSLQVTGQIEDRGSFESYYEQELVAYELELATSGTAYDLAYINKSAVLWHDDIQVSLPPSNFTVVGDTLTAWFSVSGVNATDLNATSYYINEIIYEYYNDIVPQPPVKKAFLYGSIHNVTKTDDYISFYPTSLSALWFNPFWLDHSPGLELMILPHHSLGLLGTKVAFGLFPVVPFVPDGWLAENIGRFLT